MIPGGIVTGAVVLLLVGLVWLNRRRRPVLVQAHQRFDQLLQRAEDPLAAGAGLLERGTSILQNADAQRPGSQTRELYEQAQAQREHLERLLTQLRESLAEIDEQLHPTGSLAQAGNMLSPTRYQHVLRQLEDPQLKASAGAAQGPDQPPTVVGYEEYLRLLQDQLASLDMTLGELESVEAGGGRQQSVEARLGELLQEPRSPWEIAPASLAAGELDMDELFTRTIPLIESRWKKYLHAAQRDPIGAARDELPILERQATQAQQLVDQMREMRVILLPQFQEVISDLEKRRLSTRWIERAIREVGNQANQLAQSLLVDDVAPALQDWQRQQAELLRQANDLQRLAQDWETTLPSRLEELEQRMEQVKAEVAQSIQASPNQVLRESDYRPDDHFRSAKRQWNSATSLFGRGDREGLQVCWGKIQAELKQAHHILDASQQAVAEFGRQWQDVDRRLSEVATEGTELETQVKLCEARFRGQSLEIEFGDPPQPRSLRRCWELLDRWGQRNRELLDDYHADFHRGELLQAWNGVGLLGADLDAWWELARDLREHLGQVERWAQENSQRRQALIDAQHDLQLRLDRLQDSKLAEVGIELKRQLDTLEDAHSSSKLSDPVQRTRALDDLESRQQQLAAEVAAQDHQWQQVERGLEAAQAAHQVAEVLVRGSLQDAVQDSPELIQAQDRANQLGAALAALAPRLMAGDPELAQRHQDLLELLSDFHQLNATLRSEIQEGRDAAEQVKLASQRLFEVAKWRGDDGIVVVGQPGFQSLVAAQQAMAGGDYTRARQAAASAIEEADRGLRAAKAQVSRFRQERARRARQARRRDELFQILTGD